MHCNLAHEMSYHFIIPLMLYHHSIDVANVRVNAVVHGKCDRSYQFVKWRTAGRLTVDQKVNVVLFYAETKSEVRLRDVFVHTFVQCGAPCKQTIYRLSLGTIFHPMRINSVPDVKCFCNNKNV